MWKGPSPTTLATGPTIELEPRPNTKTAVEAGASFITINSEDLANYTAEQLAELAEQLGMSIKPSWTKARFITEVISWASVINDGSV